MISNRENHCNKFWYIFRYPFKIWRNYQLIPKRVKIWRIEGGFFPYNRQALCREPNSFRTKIWLHFYDSVSRRTFNPLHSGNYSATSNNTKLVHWPSMGGLLHLVQRWGDWAGPAAARPDPSSLCNIPNVTAHPSTASVPITVLLYHLQL